MSQGIEKVEKPDFSRLVIPVPRFLSGALEYSWQYDHLGHLLTLTALMAVVALPWLFGVVAVLAEVLGGR